MTSTKFLISAAFAGLVTAGACAQAAGAEPINDKCYGIAKATQNSCASATGVHACKGQAKIDNDAGDFVYLVPVDCLGYEGKLTPPPAPAPKKQDEDQ